MYAHTLTHAHEHTHTQDLHVQRNVRKRAKRFWVSVDTCFPDVLRACQKQHGENWLYPPIGN